jgi:PAS domain S-box-containing protein
VPGLTAFCAVRHGLGPGWLATVLLILPCLVGAAVLSSRRLSSILVALGFTVACAGFVAISDGLTEAHFSFFVAVAALALYRDWAPFGAFLVCTTLHHAVFGTIFSQHTYDHDNAVVHPWTWALLHGLAVLLAAAFQVISWRLTEAEERRAEDDLAESRAQLSVAFDETPVPMVMLDPDGRLLRTNSAYRTWLGLPAELPPGFSLADIPLTPLDPENAGFLGPLTRAPDAMTGTAAYRRHDDGSVVFVEVHSNGLRDRTGRLRVIFVHCLDVTRRQEHAAELHRQVRHDSLTGLLSRAAFESDLAALLNAGPGDDGSGEVSVLYLDVDRFKSINDGSGHTAGDDVLRALAALVSRTVPAGSLVARFGGDEFVVALPCPVEAGLTVGRAVLAALAEPLPSPAPRCSSR